jgi:uncharacterized protein
MRSGLTEKDHVHTIDVRQEEGMFEWDVTKAKSNRKKHGVDFPEASTIFEDPDAITIEEQDIDQEERNITVGLSDEGHLLVVAYVYRGERIRIISARKANQYERAQYES